MSSKKKVYFLKLEVLFVWDPFIAKLKAQSKTLRVIDYSLDDKKQKILLYLQASNSPKLKERAAEWEELKKRIDSQNEKVKVFNDFKSTFSFDKILQDPHRVEKEEIQNIKEAKEASHSFPKFTKEEKEILSQMDSVLSDLPNICAQFDEFQELEAIQNIHPKDYLSLEEKENITNQEEKIVSSYQNKKPLYYAFKKAPYLLSRLNEFNKRFLEEKSKDPILDDINGRSLDNEQREAVLKEEKSSLVIAGAGSGKTLTICGKVKYLMERKGIKPENILLLSYSHKSAEDLERKVSSISPDLKVGTFHKIGLEILTKRNGKPYLVEDQFNSIVESYFREELPKNPQMERLVLNYYALFLSDETKNKKYVNEGEMYADLKTNDLMTLKAQMTALSNDREGKETIKKERVKSFEEMAIANWYFLHGVDYLYEAPYQVNLSTPEHRQYKPDFYLRKYGIYHEHYGIDKDGKASQYSHEESDEYIQSMRWKRQIHAKYKTRCIETFSYEFEDGTIFEKLEDTCRRLKIKLTPLPIDKVKDALNSVYEGKHFASFINLIKSFLNLYKAKYKDETYFETLLDKVSGSIYGRIRAKLFLQIAKSVYLYYRNWMRKDQKIDFDDMILQATDVVSEMPDYRYSWIIVDEFQDISYSRMRFLKKLIEHGNSHLFAVGDDWQSIYRFSGSDLDIFIHFDDYFGKSDKSFIRTTHRNSQELQDIVGPFIKRNPEQINKTIHSDIHLDHPVKVMLYHDEKCYAFLDCLKDISQKDSNANVLVLGRNNKDFDSIALDDRIHMNHSVNHAGDRRIIVTSYPKMNLHYSTVHGSKGLEEDYVILINADDGRLGFPNKMEDDDLLNLVLSSQSHYEYAEERRLWYVALTRTRKYVYIIADDERPSAFLKEILPQCEMLNGNMKSQSSNVIHCPRCKSGRLVLRKDSKGHRFYGCSNYPYCNYAIQDFTAVKRNKRCPVCGDFMVVREGNWGAFYSCHSYPYCKYKEPYQKKR